MPTTHHIIHLETDSPIGVYNITPQAQEFVTSTSMQNGEILIFSRHTTTALAINEYEDRLLVDIQAYLRKLAPEGDRYLHNDLHLRPGIPDDEPMNAHSHLMAMTLSTSETVPIIAGKLALGTYQSILLLELDGPRSRTVLFQVRGE